MECVICDPVGRYSPDTLFETRHWIARLRSDDQTYLGRGTVVLRRHCGDLAKLKPQEWKDLQSAIKKYEALIRDKFGATMFNWACLMNDAYKKKPYSPHVHFHVRPRYSRAVTFSGVRFVDDEFGHNYARDVRAYKPERAVVESMLRELRAK